jgi:hypothetical protein
MVRRRLWPDDDEFAEPIGGHLLAPSAVAAQLIGGNDFDAAAATPAIKLQISENGWNATGAVRFRMHEG